MRLRAILAIAVAALFLDCQRGRKKFGFAGIHGARLPPDAREIGLAVDGARRRTRRRRVALGVSADPQTIFPECVELRSVAQPKVERYGLRCLDGDVFLLKSG